MRVLFCTTDGENAFNGINAWLLDFLPALAAAGHEVSMLVFAWSPAAACFTAPRLSALGLKVRVVYPRLYTEAAVRRCLREARRAQADIFVANMVLPALLAMPRLRALGVPCVSVLHNDDDEYRAKAAFSADATVAISGGLARLIPSDGRIATVVPYGIAPFARTASAPSPGALRLVYHGRIARVQKRIEETAAAMARACRAIPGLSADLYGSGPDEAALRDQLGRDDAGGRVRFLGPRSREQLRELLPDYHVCVLLSDFEGLGLAVMEAMSAGLVPVCLRTESGLPDLIRHGENGLFVSDREAGFDATLASLAANPGDWVRLSAAARATMDARFSSAACVRAWTGLFQALAARPPRPAPADAALPPPHPALAAEDVRHPGLPRAMWRWLRFGPPAAPLPW